MRLQVAVVCTIIVSAATAGRQMVAQDLNLSPTRPTIANSATIQSPGVLQVEAGYDAYPQRVPGDQQTVAMSLYYAPLARLRLDFGWSPFSFQQQESQKAQGVGTIQVGTKVELKKEDYHRLAPGIAVQYEAELPTSPQSGLNNYGQQAIVLLNHHYGKNGDLDIIVNGSLVQANCQTQTGCTYGGQQSFAVSYHVQKTTRLYAEAFGQNNSESNTPPGTYIFGGFFHQFNDAFGIDGGLRFGVSDHSARIGTTVGLVFGKRIHGVDSKSSER
jgi:uncharacterized glyoxalase superfamily protein PhnB